MTFASRARAVLRHLLPPAIKALPWRWAWLRGRAGYGTHRLAYTGRLARWTALELAGRDPAFLAPDGCRFITMPANTSALSAFVEVDPEPGVRAFLARQLRPGAIAVDVGANIGLRAIPAARQVGASGRVIAIEAHPRTFRYLERNIALNQLGNVSLLQCAAGENEGRLQVAFTEADAGSSHVAGAGELGITVDVVPVDVILQRLGVGTIEYLKIDVEGFELPVLRGARQVLERSARVVVQVEHWPTALNPYGYDIEEAAGLLAGLGFAPFRPDERGRLQPVAADRLSAELGDVFWTRP